MKYFLAGAAVALMLSSMASAQTVVLVRHAEKMDQSADPALSVEGLVRAEALAASLAQARLSLVLATPLLRTRLTAAPAAAAAGVQITPISLEGGAPAHVARVVEAVRAAAPEDTVLVVGHSNTIPEIARALGDANAEALKECDYDRMLVIRLEPTGPVVVRARYGAASGVC